MHNVGDERAFDRLGETFDLSNQNMQRVRWVGFDGAPRRISRTPHGAINHSSGQDLYATVIVKYLDSLVCAVFFATACFFASDISIS